MFPFIRLRLMYRFGGTRATCVGEVDEGSVMLAVVEEEEILEFLEEQS